MAKSLNESNQILFYGTDRHVPMELDYQQLGLRCGLEIHQQLEGTKLFCHCPTEIRDDQPDLIFQRKLRAVVGELGHIDKAAEQEMRKDRTFIYEAYTDATCFVEMDEQPPYPLSPEHLKTALTVAKLLHGTILDEIHVMRKTIVDGSNTSGFQRTALIARNGTLKTQEGTIGVPTLILEEDAAKIIKEDSTAVTYRLDRLGIPLLEISTTPDITTPEQCKEVAEKIGLLLRSTGNVKRGLGTIRQDVNVSIKGGTRVEIKGAQDLRSLPKLVAGEAHRQKKLLEIRETLSKRNIKEIPQKITDVTELMKHSGSKIISKTIEQGGKIHGIMLPGFSGIIGTEIQPSKRLGTDMSERAKIMAGVSGIFHSDELPAYGIEQREVDELKRTLLCKQNDAFVIVAADEQRAQRALTAVIERASQALLGVPKEVRKANDDCTTSYLRPMPGASRMYPETDVPPLCIRQEQITALQLPELIETKILRYQTFGLSDDLATTLAKSDKAEFFDTTLHRYKKLKQSYIADILIGAEKTIQRTYNINIHPTEQDFTALFDALEHEELSKESVIDILKENKPISSLLYRYKLLSDTELKEELKKIFLENKQLPLNALIGKTMEKLRGKAEGKKIVTFLKELMI